MKLNPKFDGATHVNIYSKGSTWLGRELSNFTKCTLELPEGTFSSIEGYWFWLGTEDDRLKSLYGYEAKKLGSSLQQIYYLEDEDFKDRIKRAIDIKLDNNQELKQLLIKCPLPLEHYYYYGSIDSSPKVIDAGFKWLLEHFESYRVNKG